MTEDTIILEDLHVCVYVTNFIHATNNLSDICIIYFHNNINKHNLTYTCYTHPSFRAAI